MTSLASTPLDRLFRAKLRSLSVAQFRAFCQRQNWSEEEGWSQTWEDATGRRWSTLSRLGYLIATANEMGRNEALLAQGLQHHGKQGLEKQTQPGEPDLLWAWLGYNNLSANSATQAAVERAFMAVKAPGGMPTGLGLRGDAGWVDCALQLVEDLTRREGAPPRALLWWDSWMSANLLDKMGDYKKCWWNLGDISPGEKSRRALPHSLDARLPWSNETFGQKSQSRPKELGEVFTSAWVRLVDLGTLFLQFRSRKFADTDFPCGINRRGDSLGLSHHLGESAWPALENFLRAATDSGQIKSERPRPMSVASLGALNLWMAGPRTGLSEDEKYALTRCFTSPRVDSATGELVGSLVDSCDYKVSPVLLAWLNEQGLQKRVLTHENPAAASVRRPRM